MDFLDLAKGAENAQAILIRLYIVSTVTMAIVLVTTMRGIKKVRDYPYPLTIIFFAAANGLIFRALSLAALTDWPSQRSHLLTGYDYARIFFFTISDLTVHLIPIVTLHRWLARKSQSLTDDGLCGIVSMVSYFITFVIFALAICLMGIASTIPWNPDIMNAILSNSPSGPGLLPAFVNLMNASSMIYWWYVLAYVVILVKHVRDFHWSFLVFCILLIVSQIVLTISTFLPQLHSVSGTPIEIILQFIFVMQFPFLALMVATAKGASWVPPPVQYYEEEELHQVPPNYQGPPNYQAPPTQQVQPTYQAPPTHQVQPTYQSPNTPN